MSGGSVNYMSVSRKILWPFLAVVEIMLLILNWIVAIVSPKLGEKFMLWNTRVLPDPEWYNAEAGRIKESAESRVVCKFCDPPGSGVEVYGPYIKTCNVCKGAGNRNAESGKGDK